MKILDLLNKRDRIIKGMFYTEKYVSNDNIAFKVIFSPNHKLVKPAFDYIKEKCNGSDYSNNKLNSSIKSIRHYLDFCRLYGIDIEEPLTNKTLKAFIVYLNSIPKRIFQRIDKHPSEVNTLPIHPYVSKEEVDIRKIYSEWYNDYLSSSFNNFSVFYDPGNIKFDEDKQLWTYDFHYIQKTVVNVLEYLKWLSESTVWSHRYSPIDTKVAKRSVIYNKHSKEYYITWDIDKRIKEYTGLSRNSVGPRRKRRVFYETELIRFFSSKMLNEFTQRKLFFIILLLSGCRESECLNLLVKSVRVDVDPINPYSNNSIIHWEDMFDEPVNDENVDILINKFLEFNIRIAKRPDFESKRRKNKSTHPRITPLRDFFELPTMLNIKTNTIFVDQSEFLKSFEREILLEKKENNPYELVKEIMLYHSETIRSGVAFEDKRYASKYKNMIIKLRGLFDNCWFGSLLRRYLIERQLLINKLQLSKKNIEHLFINFKINKCSPIEPETVSNSWFKVICERVEPKLIRSSYIPNEILKHSKKNELTVHSFRHTYISARITIESERGNYNDALLKREIGHIPTSTVAETVYFFSDKEKINEARTKLFYYMKENLNSLYFKRDIEQKEGE